MNLKFCDGILRLSSGREISKVKKTSRSLNKIILSELNFSFLLLPTICEGGTRRRLLLSSPLSPCWKSRFTSTPCFSLSVRFRFLSQLCAYLIEESLFFVSYQLEENCCFDATRACSFFFKPIAFLNVCGYARQKNFRAHRLELESCRIKNARNFFSCFLCRSCLKVSGSGQLFTG